MDNTKNLAADVVHPLARYLDGYTDLVEAPEYVVDEVVAAGTVVVAGERGLGKTSMLVPLMMACTGLLENYPLTASIRRRVVYVAEDAAQVRRIISAMRSDGLITATRDEFNDWFRLVEANRLPAEAIVNVVPAYDDLWVANDRVDFHTYLAPPVVVMDTTNATLDLDNISDNSEVSNSVAMLRQRFGAICLVMVGHVSKASRSDVRQLSFIGAGAWEGDTQQSIYLVSDNDERFLVMGKRRFETDTTEYRITSHASSFDAFDKLGRMVEIKCFYGVPEASSEQAKEAAKSQRQAEMKAATWADAQKRVKAYVGKHEGATTREISESVTGKASSTRKALEELIDRGEVLVKEGSRGSKKHYLKTGTHGDTVGETEK